MQTLNYGKLVNLYTIYIESIYTFFIMTTTYTYQISTDFTNSPSNVNAYALQTTISENKTIVVDVSHININGDAVDIIMLSTLNTDQKNELDSVISSYVYIPTPLKASNAFSTVVDSNGDGDYTSIAAAFTAGNTSIYVRNGTYFETADIIIPNFGSLIGESTGGVAVVLLNGASVKSDGNGGTYESTGTISITYNTKAVTGIGTTFTNLIPGNYILIGTNYYVIASITDDTNLILSEVYKGSNIIDDSYYASAMNTGIIIQDLVITGSSTYGIYLRALRHSYITSVVVLKCLNNITMTHCCDLCIAQVISYLCINNGIVIDDCISFSMNAVNAFNNGGNGMLITASTDIILSSCASENNALHGYTITDTTGCIILNCMVRYNKLYGVSSDTFSNELNVNNCRVTHNTSGGLNSMAPHSNIINNDVCDNIGSGIIANISSNISNNTIKNNIGDAIILTSGGNNNIISCNNISNITGIGINTQSHSNVINGNNINNVTGDAIYIDTQLCIITSNVVVGGSVNGINIDNASSECIISSNVIKNYSGSSILIAGGATGITSANNIV